MGAHLLLRVRRPAADAFETVDYDFDSAGVELTRVISARQGSGLPQTKWKSPERTGSDLDAPQVSQQSAETMRISGVESACRVSANCRSPFAIER